MDQNQIKIYVREERPEDYRRVEEITKAAFSYPGRIEQGGIGCPYEHWMVHELRKPGLNAPFDPVASGIAEEEGMCVICADGRDIENTMKILKGKNFFDRRKIENESSLNSSHRILFIEVYLTFTFCNCSIKCSSKGAKVISHLISLLKLKRSFTV